MALRCAGPTMPFGSVVRKSNRWKDPEATSASAKAFLYPASVMILLRRLARPA